jgi:hypothetical protein
VGTSTEYGERLQAALEICRTLRRDQEPRVSDTGRLVWKGKLFQRTVRGHLQWFAASFHALYYRYESLWLVSVKKGAYLERAMTPTLCWACGIIHSFIHPFRSAQTKVERGTPYISMVSVMIIHWPPS